MGGLWKWSEKVICVWESKINPEACFSDLSFHTWDVYMGPLK